MTLLSLSLAILAVAWFVICCLWFHARGAKLGRQQGYERGFADGQFRMHQWWLEADRDVERVREEMWREGL